MLRLLRAPVLLARPAVAIRPTLALPRASVSALLKPRVVVSSFSSAPRRAMGYGGASSHGHGGRPYSPATQHDAVAYGSSDLREEFEALRSDLLKKQFADAEISTEAAPASEADDAKANAAAYAFLQGLPDESAEERVGYVLEQCDDGIERVDFVPDNWGGMQDRILVNGEVVVIPEVHNSLEWVMSCPMDEHTFEEAPAVKAYVDDRAQVGKPAAAH